MCRDGSFSFVAVKQIFFAVGGKMSTRMWVKNAVPKVQGFYGGKSQCSLTVLKGFKMLYDWRWSHVLVLDFIY